METKFIGFNEFAEALGVAADTIQTVFETAAFNTSMAIRTSAQVAVPKRSYVLMNSIIAEPIPGGAMVSVHELYGTYVEYGTGLFGPKHERITPKRAKVLAWNSGGGMVFARSTAGMKAQPFFNPSVDSNVITLAKELDTGLETIISIMAGAAK